MTDLINDKNDTKINQKKILSKFIVNHAYLNGEFKLRSGQTSNFYIDKYIIESIPDALILACDILHDVLRSKLFPVNFLGGLEVGGIPIASILSILTRIPVLFIRKKAKEYGTCKLIEGVIPDKNDNIVLVEDVITTGGQVIKSANEIRKEGYNVNHVISIIDREQGGKENLEKEGIKLHTALTLKEIEKFTK